MDYRKARRSFFAHKSDAKKRGITCYFTFDEWVNWWEDHLGPNWQRLRGCRRGQYVMARFKDEGPYQEPNVRPLLVEHNHLEGNKTKKAAKGTQRARLTKEVVLGVFNAKGSYISIAQCFGIEVFRVHCIKTGKYYSNITGQSSKGGTR